MFSGRTEEITKETGESFQRQEVREHL